MPASNKSSVTTNLKPMNIFYVWYTELCRRANASPLSIVKPAKPKTDTVLDFTADRIKSEEWCFILNALRLDTSLHVIAIRSRVAGCKFLYEVNTEDRLRCMKRRYASLWTDYILRFLIRSLGNCLKNTQVLSNLELDGLPLSTDYLELLLQSLRKNRTIKMLSFKHSPINDCGCQQLCLHLRFMPNVEVLNLSSCNLSSISGQYIARIIKQQQISRYCESWHNSLRYEDPDVGTMTGLKRITLNNNPGLGDEGLSYILEQLVDDLWIKALDVQKCNITETISSRIIDVVEYSRSLEVADFRNNEQLSYATIEKILEVLEKKHQFGSDPEYEWCMTATTLYDFSNYEMSRTNLSGMSTVIQKSKSAPLRQMESISKSSMKPPLRKTKTVALLNRTTKTINNKNQINDAKIQLSVLNAKLQEEILKRKATEKLNSELQKKLNEIGKLGTRHACTNLGVNEGKSSRAVRIVEDNCSKNRTLSIIKEGIPKKKMKEKYKGSALNKSQSSSRPKTPLQKQKSKPKRIISSPKKCMPLEDKSIVQTMFEKFLFRDDKAGYQHDLDDVNKVDDYFNYYYAKEAAMDAQFSDTPNDVNFVSGSNISLERLLKELNDFEDLEIDGGNSPLASNSIGKATIPNSLLQGHPENGERFRKLTVKIK